ncbi:class I SAM-dependent methyltransferase [Ancylomarina sp. 16SWW S1-10-2]|uniref:class I SAM-dependent methyltransferase n=1 Tax=Ancylomarina sp. 16SWW S1-10-2 TaxID=2499681 RepID=UPI0012ADC48F|nr:class I SAM-dependent methyltransferase [Ancylomarina sp. 16SWW S1-10-2]MRT92511.1 class I SAM-dependent methyltransferase [Ancylomarina sp. 16SWW S1-10-2]
MEISTHETLWLQSEEAKMLKDLGVKNSDYVIDFGCGEGRYTIPLSKIVGKDGHVYAVEQDENTMAILQKRLPLFSNTNTVSFLNINNLETSNTIPDKSIDSIFVFDVLQYIKDWDLLFSYFFRVLKPEGIICIYPAAIPHPGGVDIKLAFSKLDEIGFQFIKSTKFRMMHNVDMVEDTVYSFCLK